MRTLALSICAAALLVVAVPALASAAVTISPLNGTPDAMPQTQISILGTSASNIESVTVTGSVSGLHEGHLETYDSAPGASFLLDTPLTEGESVEAVVQLKEGGTIKDAFKVATLAQPVGLLAPSGEQPEELEHFKSAPELKPPKVKINVADPSLEGDIFTDPLAAPIVHPETKKLEFELVGPNGLMILNPAGKLLWWHQFHKEAGSNLETVSYEGKQAIAWWQGSVTYAAYGVGKDVIANSAYEPVAEFTAGNGLQSDIHELYVTPEGQAYVDAYELECRPTEFSECAPAVIDAVAQEIDIKTGLVMWEWHALTYVPTKESEFAIEEEEPFAEPGREVWDPYHINSIQPLPDERVLFSLRNTSGVYDVEKATGNIVWQIAGKKSTFKHPKEHGKEVRWYFQHDARLGGKKLNELTLFDDEGGPPIYGLSRGLVLKLSKKSFSLVHQYTRPRTSAQAEGSMQVLPHGEAVVGYGNAPYFSEYSQKGGKNKEGKLLFDAELPEHDGTYRVFRLNWEGTPNTKPAIAAERVSPGEVDVYASWNGDTNVAKWEVLAGESPEALAPVTSTAWSNFETDIPVSSSATVFEVRALDSQGKVLATSEPDMVG